MNYLKLYLRASFIVLASITVILQGFGQTSTETKPSGYLVTANASVGKNEQTLAFSGLYNWRVAFKNRFKVGLGVRSSHYFGQNQYFETAPAKFTTNQEGPQVLFVETFPGNIDSVKTASTNLLALNAYVNLEFAVTDKWDLGFNIDLAGVTVGGQHDGTFVSSYNTPGTSQYQDVQTKLRPTNVNLLLISDNDFGSLNSEAYVRYHVRDNWGVQAGLSFFFAELTSDTKYKVNFDNDRWRHKGLLGMVGVTWHPTR